MSVCSDAGDADDAGDAIQGRDKVDGGRDVPERVMINTTEMEMGRKKRGAGLG